MNVHPPQQSVDGVNGLGMGKFYWWPWLRNYNGEYALDDDSGFFAMLPYIWIDEDLKKEMGF